MKDIIIYRNTSLSRYAGDAGGVTTIVAYYIGDKYFKLEYIFKNRFSDDYVGNFWNNVDICVITELKQEDFNYIDSVFNLISYGNGDADVIYYKAISDVKSYIRKQKLKDLDI